MKQSAPASGAVLLDEIRAEHKGQGPKCKTGDYIVSLGPEAAEAITSALGEGITKAAIARWVVKRGYTGTPGTVVYHLDGECRCRTS